MGFRMHAMAMLAGVVIATPSASAAEQAAVASQAEQAAVASQLQELRVALEALRADLEASRRESEALRRELQSVRGRLDTLQPATVDAATEQGELLAAKIEDHEQTKVESGSRYHVRLSGLGLLTAAGLRGSVDNLDLPVVATAPAVAASRGSLTASVRQSLISLEVFGPTIGATKTRGELTFDFFGGFPASIEGVTSPMMRLRTTVITFEGVRTSIVVGQDAPFFSPRSPTSLISTAYPALSSAGNMWTWTPQVHVAHRVPLANESTLTVQVGALDPLTGELPTNEYTRTPTAGERSGVPAGAMRVEWRGGPVDRRAAVAAAAYVAKHDWGFARTTRAWAATTDWDVPLGPRLSVSGEWYRGRALAGLGAGASASVMFDGPPTSPAARVLPVESHGGWVQFKASATSRLEFNTAFGKDTATEREARRLVAAGYADPSSVTENASGFVNTIYQVRSNVMFSFEYRRLWTTRVAGAKQRADHLGVATGIGF